MYFIVTWPVWPLTVNLTDLHFCGELYNFQRRYSQNDFSDLWPWVTVIGVVRTLQLRKKYILLQLTQKVLQQHSIWNERNVFFFLGGGCAGLWMCYADCIRLNPTELWVSLFLKYSCLRRLSSFTRFLNFFLSGAISPRIAHIRIMFIWLLDVATVLIYEQHRVISEKITSS